MFANSQQENVNMDRTRERKFWIDFVKLYRAHPALWKIKSEMYKDRILKKQSYQKMANKLQRLYPDADVNMVKRKINSIRACFRREVIKRKHRATVLGKRFEECKPTWWLFEHLEFLLNQDEDDDENENENMWAKSIDEHDIESQSSYGMKEEMDQDTEEDIDEDGQELDENLLVEEIEFDPTTQSSYQLSDVIDVSSSKPNQKPTTSTRNPQFQYPVDNDADIYGRGWAMQYKDLTADQKIYAKKAIEDIFFEAKLGTLHRYSVKINESTD